MNTFKKKPARTPAKKAYHKVFMNLVDKLLDKEYIVYGIDNFRTGHLKNLKKAFKYNWRLWSLPEITECIKSAGFKTVDIYMQGWDDEKNEESDKFYKTKDCDADPGWIAYIIATKE